MKMSTEQQSFLEKTLNMELRFLSPTHRAGLSSILCTSDNTWRPFMGDIPRSNEDSTPKYTIGEINTIESVSVQQRRSPLEILLDEWGTSGRRRPRILDLVKILSSRPEFNKALYYVKTAILQMDESEEDHLFQDENLECRPELNTNQTAASSPVESIVVELEAMEDITSRELGSPTHHREGSGDGLEPLGNGPGPEDPVSLETDLARLDYSFLQNITRNFSEVPYSDGGTKLGSGSFGSVYYGEMNGQLGIHGPVAVKQLLRGGGRTDTQFNTEIECMRYVSHPNLLNLLAYSNDGEFLCLVYEYMEGGNLKDRLLLKSCSTPLSERQRLDISLGTATGLSFLHKQSHTKTIVHRDIKPENILLDGQLRPKISDFGLVRLVGTGDFGLSVDQTCTLTGTPLYMSPEAMRGEVSDKMDVYSFGVVLLEILTSIPAIGGERTGYISLMSYVEELDSAEEVLEVVDPVFSRSTQGAAIQLVRLAETCLKRNRRERPTMEKVRSTLEQLTTQL